MDSGKPLVVITGISGYLGSQVCKAFLENGTFEVRGTVRSATNPKKIEPLKKAFGEHFDQLTLAEADLLDKQSLIKACEGAQYIVHTASPFPIKIPKNEQELIKPAVEGTTAILEAAQLNKVKRVVITSSVAALYCTKDKKKVRFTTEDWSDLNAATPYEKSKTLAEKAAWEFQEKLPEDERFEIVTINPGLILGPTLVSSNFSSGDVVKKFMHREMPGVPKVQFPVVDVRNVAQAHLKGLTEPGAANKRFMLVSRCMWFNEIGEAIFEKYGKTYNAPRKVLPKIICQIGSIFDKDVRLIMPQWGKVMTYENQETTDVLGIEWFDEKQTVQEMAETLIEVGYVKDKRPKA